MEKERNYENDENGKEKKIDIPGKDIFFCPECHHSIKISYHPLYCDSCGFKFIFDNNGELLLDDENYALFPQNVNFREIPNDEAKNQYNPPNMIKPLISLNESNEIPFFYQKTLHKKKKKTWNILTGILLPLATMALVFFGIIILEFILDLFPSIPAPIRQFLLASPSILFLIVPVLWIQFYYPGKLTFKQKAAELGLPLNKYDKPELIREILLGIFLGLILIISAYVIQILGFWIVKLFYKTDVYKLIEISQIGEVFTMNTSITLGELFAIILINLLFVGIAEEIMFRGFVQKCFESKLKNSWALIFTAFFFAQFHIWFTFEIPAIYLFFLVNYFILSLILGQIRNWRKDLIAVSIAHIVYNIGIVIFVYIILL